MEKQELNHIQHYPIGGENALRVKFIDSNYKKHHNQNITDTGIIVGLNIWNITNSTLLSIESSSNGLRHSCTLDEIKPILRPMSDLCKPLEDGTIFIIELFKLLCMKEDPYEEFGTRAMIDYLEVDIDWMFYYDNTEGGFRYKSDHQDGFIPNQLELFSYLFSHHFDVFGLIDKGLAIDCNELKTKTRY